MYKNRISRPTPNRDLQLFIRQSDIAFDNRARYVEFVCGIWNEGRFGPDSVSPFVLDQSGRPELDSARAFDFDDNGQNGPALCFVLSPPGRAGFQVADAAYRKAKQMGLVDAGPNVHNSPAALTPNQGRGSP